MSAKDTFSCPSCGQVHVFHPQMVEKPCPCGQAVRREGEKK